MSGGGNGMTGAEILVRTAASCGIRVCFANPGTTEIPFVAALDAVPGIKPVLCLFEGVCTGAADGYGRVSATPAMTLLHLGPGLGNGIANLHNAQRARTPLVNIVGEHATWHRPNDPPLAMDIEGLAGTVSGWQKTSGSASELSRDLALGVAASLQGRVSTLIVPNDLQQTRVNEPAIDTPRFSFRPVDGKAIERAAMVARSGGRRALILGGGALRERGLRAAARVAAAAGWDLLAEGFPAYLDRGPDLPFVDRIPYFPEPALQLLSRFDAVALVGVKEPVSFFGYRGVPGRLLPERVERADIWTEGQDEIEVLEALADASGTARNVPGAPAVTREGAGRRRLPGRPHIPSGGLSPEKACAVLAALQPEGAVIVDEALTSGFSYYDISSGAPPHCLTMVIGGAIGYGVPCAVGAALAAPGRRVINLQADGSALYTVQALWTQAREGLDITTLICSNRSYHIVEVEFDRAGIRAEGAAARGLTSLSSPPVRWPELARGLGVPGVSVETVEELARELTRALSEPGPRLIEMLL